jgi:hypothetical protein
VAAARARRAGSGFLRFSDRGVFMAPPGVSMGTSLSPREAWRTGAVRLRGVRVALLSGAF